jgi:hypothetical protein
MTAQIKKCPKAYLLKRLADPVSPGTDQVILFCLLVYVV